MTIRDSSRETMLLARLTTLQQVIGYVRQEQQDVLEELVQIEAAREHRNQAVRAAKAATLRNLSTEDLQEIFRLLYLKAPKHYAEALSLITPEQLEQLEPIYPNS